ncbi:MAG: Mutator family transposase [Clostridium sp.]|jgi:putative transposase
MTDLKHVYQAVTEALENFSRIKEKWGESYPSCVKNWEDNRETFSTFYAYPVEIRKIIYTTNIIESLNRKFWRITKNKPSFTNDDSLRKMLYLASKKIVEHWTCRCHNGDFGLTG